MIAIIKASILKCIRDRKNLIFMIFFPLFLVFIIGSTLSSYFNKVNSSAIEGLSIYYIDESNDKTSEVFNKFIDIVKESKDIRNVEFKEISNVDEGKQEVRVNKTILLYLKDNSISMYSNESSVIRSSIIFQMLNIISDRYNVISEIYKLNPIKAEEILTSSNNENFIEEENIPYTKSPRAIDYYGVAEIGLMLFYFIIYPLFYLQEDKRSNIKDRINLSGVSTAKYYLASFIGFFIFSYGVSLITYILSKIFFNVNYGDNLLVVPMAIIPFLIIINGLGTIIPMIFKESKVATTILQSIIIPVLSFLGGGYIAIYGDIEGIFNLVTKISPLRWFNSSVFRYIYSNDSSLLINWLIFGGIILVLIVIIINLITRMEEKSGEKYISFSKK